MRPAKIPSLPPTCILLHITVGLYYTTHTYIPICIIPEEKKSEATLTTLEDIKMRMK